MKVSYSGKDFKIGEQLQNRITEKLGRFDRYFGQDAAAHVTVRTEREMKRSDVTIRVPERETFKVQELHLPVYHCLCAMAEERFFGPAD